MSTATTLPPRLRLEAPATRNEPIPPTPITANRSAGPCATLDKACRATASGWAIAAASSSHWPGTWRQIAAGETTSSASPPSTWRPSVRYSEHRFVRPSRHHRQWPHEIPAPETTRSPTLMSVTSSPAATTRPTNSCPRTTPGRQRIGPWSHSAASVPADRRADHLEQHLSSIRRRGLWHVLNANVARAVEDGRFHSVSTRSGL